MESGCACVVGRAKIYMRACTGWRCKIDVLERATVEKARDRETDEYESMLLDDSTTVGVQINVDGMWCMCTCVVLPHWLSVNLA